MSGGDPGCQAQSVCLTNRRSWDTVSRFASDTACSSAQAGTDRTIGISWSSDISPRRTAAQATGSSSARSAAATRFDAIAGPMPQRHARYWFGVHNPSPFHSFGLASSQTVRSSSRPVCAFT